MQIMPTFRVGDLVQTQNLMQIQIPILGARDVDYDSTSYNGR